MRNFTFSELKKIAGYLRTRHHFEFLYLTEDNGLTLENTASCASSSAVSFNGIITAPNGKICVTLHIPLETVQALINRVDFLEAVSG